MSHIAKLIERLRDCPPSSGSRAPAACPFCGYHPYEYVNNGVCMEAVAVTCCEFGQAFFDWRIDDPVVNRIGTLLMGDARQKRRGERLLKKLESGMEACA